MSDTDGKQGRDATDAPQESDSEGDASEVVRLLEQVADAIRQQAASVVAPADVEAAALISDALWDALERVQQAVSDYDGEMWEDDGVSEQQPFMPDGTQSVLDVVSRWRFAITDAVDLHAVAEALESDCVALDGTAATALEALVQDRWMGLDEVSESLVVLQSTLAVAEAGEDDLEDDAVAAAISLQYGFDTDDQ